MTHPDRQISEEIAEAWRRVHITAWEFEGNIRPTNWTEEDSWVQLSWGEKVGEGGRRVVVRIASTQHSGLPGSGWAAMENEKETTLTAITLGSKYSVMFGLQLPLTCKPWTTLSNLANKVRGKYFYKEVFLRLYQCVRLLFIASVLPACVFIVASVCIQYIYMHISAWTCIWEYNSYPLKIVQDIGICSSYQMCHA